MRRKILSILLCLSIICVSQQGCSYLSQSGENSNKQTIKIGFALYDQYDTFISELFTYVTRYFDEKEKESGVTIIIDVASADGNQLEQNNQVDDFIEKGYDVICVNIVDRTAPTVIIDKARKADIPLIFFNREVVEEDLQRWDKLYYVGAVTLEPGIMQGQIVTDIYKENNEIDKNGDGILQYVMLEGEAGHQDAVIRTEYSIKTIGENGVKLEKLSYSIANWKRSQAQSKMMQWLEEYGNDIEVVISNNDDMAVGAIDALISADISKEQWPVIVGIDGTTVGLNEIRKGNLDGTVYNDKGGQAKGIVELAFSLASGEELSDEVILEEGKYIRLPHQIITIENVEEFMAKS